MLSNEVLSKISKIIDIKGLMPCDVKQIIDIYELKEKSNYESKPLYRVAVGNLPNNENEGFTFIMRDFSCRYGNQKITAKKKTQKQMEEENDRYDSWKVAQSGTILGGETECINVNTAFAKLRKEKIKWQDILNYLLDDTDSKDPRLLNIMKSYLVYIPMNCQHFQSYNNHSLMLTNTGIGKSVTAETITGEEPASSYSEAGLFGSVDVQKKSLISGILNGSGLYCFDEATARGDEKAFQDKKIIDIMLNYFETGKNRRSLVGATIDTIGTKSLLFFSNVGNSLNKSDFKMKIIRLCDTSVIDRVGKRFCHVIYCNDLNTVRKRIKSETEDQVKEKIRILIRETQIKYNWKVSQCFRNAERMGLLASDPEYKKSCDEYCRLADEGVAGNFIKGNGLASERLKFASLRLCIVEHLPDFIRMTNTRFLKLVKEKLENNYKMFVEYNKISFNNIVNIEEESKFDNFCLYMKDKNVTTENVIAKDQRELIEKEIGISEATFFRMMNRYRFRRSKFTSEGGA